MASTETSVLTVGCEDRGAVWAPGLTCAHLAWSALHLQPKLKVGGGLFCKVGRTQGSSLESGDSVLLLGGWAPGGAVQLLSPSRH